MGHSAQQALITEQQYLDAERQSSIRHEFVDGEVVAMAGGSRVHNELCVNLLVLLKQHLKGSGCKPYISDVQFQTHNNYYYPDLMVDCQGKNDEAKNLIHEPTIIVEVLSNRTRKYDKTTKKLAYMNTPSVQEYVLIEQEFCEIQVFRRNQDWQPSYYYFDDSIYFDSIDATFSVADIYEDVAIAELIEKVD